MNAVSSTVIETKIDAFQKIHAEFKDILKHEKCRTCSCLHADVLNIILEKIKTFRKSESDRRLVVIENDFERWANDADILKMHG
jgi:hypothetical protein